MKPVIRNFRRTVSEITRILLGKETPDHITRHLVKGTSGTFGLNVSANILLFIISIVLARILGASGYGTYTYALTWLMVLSIPAGMGLGRILIRNIASYHTQSAWSLIAGHLRWANRIVLAASLITIAVALVITWFLREQIRTETVQAIWLVMFLLPVIAIMRVRQSIMQGLHRVVIGQLPESLLLPLSFLLLTGIGYFFFRESIDALWAIGMHVIAGVAAFLVSIYLLRRVMPDKARHAVPDYESRVWLRSGLAMMLMGGLNIINSRADILMLGAITGEEAVGIYNIAVKGGELITFVMITVHASLGPTIASLYTSHDMERLQRIITKSTRIIFALSLPIGLGFILFGYWFLLIFGTEFTQGQVALVILSIAQLLNVFIGPVALILIMTRHEREAMLGLGISAALNITLNAILIPRWGLEGAATATATSLVLWNIVMSILVYRRIRIYSAAL